MACLVSTAPVCRGTARSKGNRLPEQLFDRAPLKMIFGSDETGRLTGRIHTGRTADPMDVVLGTVGQIEIHHMSDVGDVDAARRNIGRDENAKRPSLEPF